MPHTRKHVKYYKEVLFISTCIKLELPVSLKGVLLSLRDDVEINAGITSNFAEAFFVCQWNLNGFAAKI